MKLSALTEKLGLTPVTEIYDDREVSGCYCGDLLSWVMGRAREDEMWITVMSNVNILAVAALTDIACIVLAEEVSLEPEVAEKAKQQEITVLRSADTAYAIAAKFHDLTGI